MSFSRADARPRTWSRKARTVAVGVALGGVQVLLLVALPAPLYESLGWFLLLSPGGYFLFALLEGYLSSSQREDTLSGIAVGCLVGVLGVLAVVIFAVTLITMHSLMPDPPCRAPLCPRIAGYVVPAEIAVAVLLMLAEGLWALVASMFGGWLGGVLGRKAAH